MYELILFGNLYSFYEVDYVTRLGREVMGVKISTRNWSPSKTGLDSGSELLPALFRTLFF